MSRFRPLNWADWLHLAVPLLGLLEHWFQALKLEITGPAGTAEMFREGFADVLDA